MKWFQRVHSATPPSTSHATSGSRLELNNHKDVVTVLKNHNNIHPQSTIGIAQPTVQNLLNPSQLLPSQLHALAAQGGIPGMSNFISLPNGKNEELNFFLKQIQTPTGNGAGTLNNSSGSVLYSSQKS